MAQKMKQGLSASRRQVLKTAGAFGMATALASKGFSAKAQSASMQPILREIPKTGERVPAIGLGSFETFDILPGQPRRNITEIVRRFHEGGGRMIDTSPLYGTSEVVIGDALATLDIADNCFMATKSWETGRWLGDNMEALRQFEQSQMRLWKDPIELVLVHSLTNAASALRFLREMKESGRIRYIGVTHFNYAFFDNLEPLVASGTLDFVQFNYSIFSRLAEERLLPLAADTGTAVMTNMPFEKARLFECTRGQPLPEWASDIDCNSWAQFFLKYIISHPAVTCTIPATSNPDHMSDNIQALYGRLPDQNMRREMVRYMQSLPGFEDTLSIPPYPGKDYGGVAEFPLQ